MKIVTERKKKGGVGKTTSTMNLGVALKELGKRVLLIDFDPQNSLSIYLNHDGDDRNTIDDLISKFLFKQTINLTDYIKISENDEIEYIPSSPYLSVVEKQMETRLAREMILNEILADDFFKQYDYILIDTSPSISTLMTNALATSTDIIIPVQSQYFTIESLRLVYNTIEQIKAHLNANLRVLGILPTMIENTVMSRMVLEHLKLEYKKDLFNTTISKSTVASESTAIKTSLVKLNSKLGEQYLKLAKEVINKE